MEEKNTYEEIKALIKYLVNHNEDHVGELSEYLKELKEYNAQKGIKEIEEAISLYKDGNQKLKDALDKLDK